MCVEAGNIVIRRARIVDPSRQLDRVGDLLIGSGEILAAGRLGVDRIPDGCRVIDGAGLVASPGFIDLHCHLREPGFEYKETIAAGSRAAAKGGFTTLCAMPNTDPPIDNAAVVEFIHQRARRDSVVRILPIGCVTKGRKGHQLAEMEELASAGVVAFSDDGDPVYDANLMRLALIYSLDLGLPISNHCQDLSLSCNGVMAEGPVATHLGLDGIPAAAEEAMIARDIALAEATGGRLHIAHLSTAGSVPLVREAKERGLSVTAEVCPHHLTTTEQWVMGRKGEPSVAAGGLAYDTSTKVYPPLRSQRDVDALIQGLADGVIDCIATDHAPHDLTSKQVTYQEAAFGISVLETALGSLLQLVHTNKLSMGAMVDRLTAGPARVLGESYSDLASLQPGTTADIVLFDPEQEWTVDTSEFESKGRNTPLEGTTLKGRVVATFVSGSLVYEGPGLKFEQPNAKT
ncbi:MAG: dihydroorotase [Chloroflexi bacterium]|nr:dihydroorotase [Chloroflexota bacterium]MCI0810246.1 dihydroorotase [Chloroflexota bacterium]MCI0863334.1 dihydroorotase [Chloroflexota bacterium]MCI0896697.1 dihydroorotase [Chloroflexota bacterium]MCI0900244.1 dihydroorotase [Chloroflexota bacterium]